MYPLIKKKKISDIFIVCIDDMDYLTASKSSGRDLVIHIFCIVHSSL